MKKANPNNDTIIVIAAPWGSDEKVTAWSDLGSEVSEEHLRKSLLDLENYNKEFISPDNQFIIMPFSAGFVQSFKLAELLQERGINVSSLQIISPATESWLNTGIRYDEIMLIDEDFNKALEADWREAIRALQSQGVEIKIVSGSQENPAYISLVAEQIANAAGVTRTEIVSNHDPILSWIYLIENQAKPNQNNKYKIVTRERRVREAAQKYIELDKLGIDVVTIWNAIEEHFSMWENNLYKEMQLNMIRDRLFLSRNAFINIVALYHHFAMQHTQQLLAGDYVMRRRALEAINNRFAGEAIALAMRSRRERRTRSLS